MDSNSVNGALNLKVTNIRNLEAVGLLPFDQQKWTFAFWNTFQSPVHVLTT